jgi:hypothetical protein
MTQNRLQNRHQMMRDSLVPLRACHTDAMKGEDVAEIVAERLK